MQSFGYPTQKLKIWFGYLTTRDKKAWWKGEKMT